jgi:hypothetical protein
VNRLHDEESLVVTGLLRNILIFWFENECLKILYNGLVKQVRFVLRWVRFKLVTN